MSTPPLSPASVAWRWLAPWGRALWLNSLYNLGSLPLGVAGFTVMVTGLSLGLGLLITLIGVPVLALTVYAARAFAHLERARIRGLLRIDTPTPRYAPRDREASWLSQVTRPLRDPQSWLDVVWSLASIVTGVAVFVVTVTWWAVVGAGLTYWIWARYLPDSPDDVTLSEILGLGEGPMAESLTSLACGLLALLTLPAAMRACAVGEASLARVLLSSRAELQDQIVRVAGSRDAARASEAHSLRRLERDIHDGPQQRLVRVSMDLGRARKQLDDDPEAARQTLDAALGQTRETVHELRSLSRGIAPPILVDRGLAAALEDAGTRATLPVTMRLDVPAQMAPHVETAVYFLVSEALANVAKHSFASAAEVSVGPSGSQLVVEVRDNGQGGAAVSKGHGLAGLAQRLQAADGRLTVDSPEGGPTLIRAELPCA
ncbi:MAG: sensor histidine kinase [Nocardioides sp.]